MDQKEAFSCFKLSFLSNWTKINDTKTHHIEIPNWCMYYDLALVGSLFGHRAMKILILKQKWIKKGFQLKSRVKAMMTKISLTLLMGACNSSFAHSRE